ncbi:30S ribosomal protein S2 [Candidatus Woesebacteria bacterium GWB1_43_5]|uniref:Small ribosomal subunit protein uS2 n=1 Tax=Candidatus Woesebacteria bacterium GWB1_43_5 TaxID=1802474 RepID=A0A1F7WS62_9BACT|nr:MAG: 30S ribosomal protein S2 [Candidatus Woesebacteria bacterium GWB1_43_5]
MTVKISLDELAQRGAHFGHQTRRWNPKMAEFIYGQGDGVHIFDLIKTKEKLEEAIGYLKEAKKEGKVILFVGTKKQAKGKVRQVAESLGFPYIIERWLGGTITNYHQIKKSLDKLKDMHAKRDAGEYKVYTKKERLLLDREITRLERFFGGMSSLNKLPDIIFVVDVKRESTAVLEASGKGIPIVAIVDSNCDPSGVDYVIPMNDDAAKAVEYVLDLINAELLPKHKTEDLKPKTKTNKTKS